jgi:hypothetical protein
MSTCSKIKFPSEKLALEDIVRQKLKGGNLKAQRAYECPKCNCWHITSIPEGGEMSLKNALVEIERLRVELSKRDKETFIEQKARADKQLLGDFKNIKKQRDDLRERNDLLVYKNLHGKRDHYTFLEKLKILFLNKYPN